MAPSAPGHKCPGHDCEAQVTAGKLMCPACWRQVPADLQDEVYAAWNRGRGRGSLRHLRAMQAAIKAVQP
jgi:hypothetical protein